MPNREIRLEFGEVEADATAVEWIEIVNESCREQIYEARRDATTNPLDHVFELCSYSWTLCPGQAYKCKIYYRPFVPFSVNVDYFTIVDSAGERTEIRVRGTCVGPVITFSTTRLVMMCVSKKRETKKRVKLINDSKATATFMFDVDQVQRSFTVDLRYGHVGPRSRKYVTITFAPRQVGIYACHLPCLILNHKPIIIELYGYYGTALHKADIQSHFNYPARLKNGFEGYTRDTIVAMRDLPAFSLSKNYIDFGQADAEAENAAQLITETLCLTNHSRSDLLIKWDQDIDGIFNITPVNAKISADQTALFEVTFNPDRRSNFFARELVGHVFSEKQKHPHEEVLAFPMITSVRLIGHSFPVCSDGWIPQYEIPHIVKMPPCLPSFPVYTTFVMKKFGHLPLMYRFVPPASSHFVVKPMTGIIYQDYQIVVVGMLPGSDDERLYVERWAIHFNGNASSECFIDFRGFAEYANIGIYNDRNVLRFATSFPGCRQQQQFSMRNITRHTIKYEFVNAVPELRIQNLSGEICSNDIITHEWEFCPTIIGDYEFNVNCILVVLKNEIPVGPTICVMLRVMGKCEAGFLVSVPDELNFGIQAYKTTEKLFFYVFNLSPVSIHYKMTCSHCNWPIGDIEQDVKVHPMADTVTAGQYKAITVSITPCTPGCYEFFLRYFVRISSHADALIPNQTPKNICKLSCLCVLPSLKVRDLQYYGSCPIMNKAFLWKEMKMNEVNVLLRGLQPGTSRTLHINFPAMVLHENPIVIKLLLTNASVLTNVIASWNIKRVQLCSCRPVAKIQGLSFQRVRHDCLHRKVCSIQPKIGNLKPGEEAWISLELHYVLLGKTEAKWDLDLGDNRHIFLVMSIESLSGIEDKLHFLSGTHFRFQHIYFGDKNPVYQVCWLRNSTNRSVPFSVNRGKILEINQKYCYELFSCATPHGIINPQSSFPILLKFQPRQFGVFKEKLSLTLNNEETELILEGESSLPHNPTTIGEYVPSNCSTKIDDIPVYFNTEYIEVLYVSTHSHAVRTIMIQNNLKHDTLAYEWKRREIPGVIYVEIHPRKGLIKPKAVQTFRVTINTEGCPCIIDVNIPCEFINTGQRRAYQRSVYRFDDLSREFDGQFIITEKGISIPKPSIKILEKPQPFYKSIMIHCSVYGLEDKFWKVNLMKELKGAPPNGICIEKDEKQEIIFSKGDINRASFILEGLLWEIVNSKLFKNLTQDILQKEMNLFYSQFRMNLHERKKLIQRSYISPPRALINRILEKMLFIIMHEEFALETIHLIPHADIRHTNYLNIVSGMNRRKTIKRERRLLYQDKEYPDKISKSPTSSRISFSLIKS